MSLGLIWLFVFVILVGRLRSLLVFVLVLVVADGFLRCYLGSGCGGLTGVGMPVELVVFRLVCLVQFLRFCGFCCSVFM